MNRNNPASKKATPEQVRAYRGCLLTVVLGNIAIILVGGCLTALLLTLFHRNPAVIISIGFGMVVFAWIGGQIFTFLYFRCPVCGRPMPSVATSRGSMLGHSCKHCNLDFSAKMRP